jgi:tetratricopeptide (TPR) repeat protein
MRFSLTRNKSTLFWAVALFLSAFGSGLLAQEQQQPSDKSGPQGQAAPAQNGKPEAPKLNPKEEADYKAFVALPDGDRATADKKIQLGQQFMQKYPESRYEEMVDNQIVSAYYAKQDWANFYVAADKAIAKDPDDVDVLTVVGWVIPHLYNHDEPDAEKKLDKAESYEKHAIEVIPSLPRPDNLSDDQFAQAKAGKLSEAHSGLGLVYFRQQDFANSVKELQLATQDNSSPDPTDLYALGAGLLQLNRNSEASDAFGKCGAIAGSLQDRCKQLAAQAKGGK